MFIIIRICVYTCFSYNVCVCFDRLFLFYQPFLLVVALGTPSLLLIPFRLDRSDIRLMNCEPARSIKFSTRLGFTIRSLAELAAGGAGRWGSRSAHE